MMGVETVDLSELHAYGYAAALLIGLGLGIEREHAAQAQPGPRLGSTRATPVPAPSRSFPSQGLSPGISALRSSPPVSSAWRR
ncbi:MULTISPECIES: hypothetical protein [Rhodococcus]|uniref:hypothetical protein n=1 Tax=Rhodococcus TaxID=1827 RepID=UPI0002A24535|nr:MULTISPECIES: hypothetical protein [Rhodococcus]ELB90343.1 hypothetical protein Rwratislav_24811 [Rhodococcus wratislaviensis IFP 2016]MDX5964939.1 hypothetical protein [Rhodococcus opacus]QQZ19680.1 hypothetical protein GO592_42775 [Rhodococcus sp. 21391]UNN01577.1 hypothetical protein MOO23_03470 [Rhodococcus opacus]UNN05082.1 hypothetical protein MOO23_39890 [Rhodococcus opacus]